MGLRAPRLPFRDEEAHDWEGVARSGQETLEIIQSYAGDISAMFKGTLARQKALQHQMTTLSRIVLDTTNMMLKIHAAYRHDDI